MILKDNIYGKTKIEKPILLELLRAPSILRLKKISQYGIPDKYYHFKNYSRYEHSVGVMILLKKLGATLEEQVAGLLHDISVLTFSHIADWVFSDGRKGIEGYHETIHKKFVKKTKIPEILKKHNLSLKRILNEKNFSLLEKKAPDLCADRIDYALREFKYWLAPEIVKRCIKALVNYNGEIVFSDKKVALEFANNFLKLQTKHWGGYQSIIRYHLFSKTLEIALKKKIIQENDFYRDESFILTKLENSRDEKIKSILVLLKKKDLENIERNSGRKVFKKFRYVDPKVISNGRLVRLGKIAPRFQQIIDKHKKLSVKGLVV